MIVRTHRNSVQGIVNERRRGSARRPNCSSPLAGRVSFFGMYKFSSFYFFRLHFLSTANGSHMVILDLVLDVYVSPHVSDGWEISPRGKNHARAVRLICAPGQGVIRDGRGVLILPRPSLITERRILGRRRGDGMGDPGAPAGLHLRPAL